MWLIGKPGLPKLSFFGWRVITYNLASLPSSRLPSFLALPDKLESICLSFLVRC